MKATLSPEEFNTLLRLAQAVDLVQTRAQLEHLRAVTKRDAYYATLAQAYGLPPTWAGLTWHEDTCVVDVMPAADDARRVAEFPVLAGQEGVR